MLRAEHVCIPAPGPISGCPAVFIRSVQHVRDYSRDVGRFEQAVAKTESEELGRNIGAKAQQEFAAARQKADSDPATVEALISIEK